MSRGISLFLATSLIVVSGLPAKAQDTTSMGGMGDGGTIRIDPTTHRAVRVQGDEQTPLWDGVHRLEDGSVVIVKDGVAITDANVTDTLHRAEAEPVQAAAYCMQLVRKVCGRGNECAEQKGCSPARQLLKLEQDERRNNVARGLNVQPETAKRCADALLDEVFFAPCESATPARPTPCHQLMDKSCGPAAQCASSTACDAAKQLYNLETEELTGGSPEDQTETGRRCTEALADDAFFTPCRH